MDAIGNIKSWIGSLTDIALMLIALAIAATILVGGDKLAFFGSVVENIKNLVSSLGADGLAGLITVGVILWLFSKRKVS